MSLLVRLPLNGNLNNYGSADVTVTNNGATVSDNGKLGKCYAFNGSSNYLKFSKGYFGSNWSYSIWVYTTSTTSTQTLGCCRTTTDSGFSLFLIGGKLRIDPGGNNVQWTTGYTYPANTWFHLTVTCDNGSIKYYINGEYKETYSTTLVSSQWGNTVSIGSSQQNGSSYGNYLNGRLNDIRIYDHCLSESEIKHLIRGKGLQLWMPLTKDLRQQGLSNVTVTNNGATFNSAGKLGGCYSFNNSAIGIGATNITLGNTFSIACWIKVNSYNSNWANAFKIYKDGYDYIGLCMNQTSASTKQLGFHIYKNNGSNARTGVYDAYYMPLTVGTWYHLCFVVTPSEVKTYQNGVNIRTGSITTTFPSVSNYNLGLGKSSSFGGLDCSMNDFRLYDHALSEKEVKELAKGLVLHYPLNRGGWGQENLLRGSNMIGSGTTTYGWVSNGNATSMEILSDGSLHYKYNVSNSKYIPSITTNTVVPCEFSKTYFYSMDLKFDKAITLGTSVPMHFWVGARNSDSITNTNCHGNLTGIQTQYITNHSGTLPANTWVHITTKFTFPAAATSSGYNYPAIRCFVYGSVLTETTTGEVNIWMKNCKVEESLIETPWCPHVEDALATTMGLNSTTEYDCSGFCNNGTRTGTFSWTSDTPKYQVSTHIGATNQKIHISNFPTSGFGNSYSFAWWGKRTSNSPMFWGFSDGIRLNGMYGTLWNTGDSSNNPIYKPGTTTTITAPSTNIWHHYVMTGDGTTCKLYLDGELYGQAKTYKAISGTSIWINGWDSGTQYCSDNTDISDFRIYATALSADDIAELYNGGVL